MDDDISLLDFADGDATAHGILQCLRMLTDEASTLRLGRTLAALRAAMKICAEESGCNEDTDLIDNVGPRALGLLLH